MLALAVLGARELWTHMRGARRRVFATLLGLCMAFTGVGIATQHPYQYAYYQPLVQLRGMDYNELDYWNVSARDDMSQLGLDRSFATLAAGEQAALEVVADPEAPYLFSNTTYAIIYEVDPPEGYHVLFTLDSYSIPICTVYERD